jgi:rare lipoprotein A
MTRLAAIAAGAALLVLGAGTLSPLPSAEAAEQTRSQPQRFAQAQRKAKPEARQQATRVKPQRGIASFYAPRFNGRKMANGQRFNPRSNSAAHRTLPLGTVARVTNLENGKSVEVTIKDRGPFVAKRIIDLSPRSAKDLGIERSQGLANVLVTPIDVPGRNEQVSQR